MTNPDKPLETSFQNSNKFFFAVAGLALVGFLDAIYLTVSHFTGHIACSLISGCQEVLTSQYSQILGIPLALLGALYYFFILINTLLYIDNQNKWSKLVILYLPIGGFIFSLYLIYLMFFVINALCQYCLLSALTSTLLAIASLTLIRKNKLIK